MKMSEILRIAADEYLLSSEEDPFESHETSSFSCCAVGYAARGHGSGEYHGPERQWYETTFDILYNYAFDEFPAGIERQAVRHAWLHLAADYAEEQGL